MPAYSIIRIAKLKSWGAIAGAVTHNSRLRETPNANPEALCHNKFLIGSPTDDPVAVCKERLGGQRIRKNAVYGVDGFLGASPEYFRPDDPGRYGYCDPERLKVWVETNVSWLKERFGDRVINAVLHLDESTAHIQFLLLPVNDKGKLSYKSFFGGKKFVLSQLQTDYAATMSHLGLSRGQQGSQATHLEVSEYYTLVKSLEHTPAPKMPPAEAIPLPEPPGTVARIKTENVTAYAQTAAAKALEEVGPMMESLTRRNDTLTSENHRLKRENETLKESNSRLSQVNAEFKTEANRLRELSLDLVLTKMYGATESPESKPGRKTRTFILPDGLQVEFTGSQWQTNAHNERGKGAVNLVMQLSGYGQSQYQQAVRDMAEVFSDKEAAASLARYQVETAERETQNIIRRPFQMPMPARHSWPAVRAHLVDKMELPADLIDQAHQDGLLFSDRRYNCVFARDQSSGVFKFGTGDKPFEQVLGRDGKPFVIPGSDNRVFITWSPVDALALKALHPDSTILATSRYMLVERLKPYCTQKEVYLAQSQDKETPHMIKYLAEHLPNAKRLQPEQGSSWTDCWRLRLDAQREAREERHKAKLQQRREQQYVAEQNQANGFGR